MKAKVRLENLIEGWAAKKYTTLYTVLEIKRLMGLPLAPDNRETPKQYKARAGVEWPEDAAVYQLVHGKWEVLAYKHAKTLVDLYPHIISANNDFGCPRGRKKRVSHALSKPSNTGPVLQNTLESPDLHKEAGK